MEALLPPGPIGFAASEAPAGATGQAEETTGESTTTTETTTETASTETTSTESGEPASVPTPLAAQGEDFAGRPSDVLLTYPEAVEPQVAERCVAVSADGSQEDFGNVEAGATPQTLRLYLVPGGEMPAEVDCPSSSPSGDASAQTAQSTALSVAAAQPTSGGVLSDPIDPKYLTEVPFGARSFWIQPWRAYLDTWPASRLIDSLGINFNVTSKQAEDTAQLLQESGFKLARIEIGWNSLSYADPSKFANEADIDARLEALHKHGLRPLILLNANSGQPAPAKGIELETTEEAAAGATTVKLTPASAEQVVPGKTGFNDLSFGGGPDLLITSVNGEDLATLSKPLPKSLTAGTHSGTTLLYGPFGPPELEDGEPNPAFQETISGWLSYVSTICKKAESIFGAGGYDLEVWNELSFGSQFLNEGSYYSPARVDGGLGSVNATLLDETVAYVRNPANGISPEVGITNGFASETPFAAGALQPPGTTAFSKHLYAGPQYFPASKPQGSTPIDALGERESSSSPFTPELASALPEYYLTATQTETIVRDLSPITTYMGGTPHGRDSAPEGSPPPQVWMTEYNLNTKALVPLDPSRPDRYMGPGLTSAQRERLQAEIALRSLISMISKGMSREYFYAVSGEGWNLVSESFMNEVNSNPSAYPGAQAGGPTMAALRELMQQLQGPGPEGEADQLQLLSIAQEGEHAEFAGDGTAAHPNLYDRELLAVFPFQSSPTRFVVPFYVMTPNLTTAYNNAPEGLLTRFDLPSEKFRITLANLPETAAEPTVSAYDPLEGESSPARLISRKGQEAVFEVAATDYPRLLEIEYPTH